MIYGAGPSDVELNAFLVEARRFEANALRHQRPAPAPAPATTRTELPRQTPNETRKRKRTSEKPPKPAPSSRGTSAMWQLRPKPRRKPQRE